MCEYSRLRSSFRGECGQQALDQCVLGPAVIDSKLLSMTDQLRLQPHRCSPINTSAHAAKNQQVVSTCLGAPSQASLGSCWRREKLMCSCQAPGCRSDAFPRAHLTGQSDIVRVKQSRITNQPQRKWRYLLTQASPRQARAGATSQGQGNRVYIGRRTDFGEAEGCHFLIQTDRKVLY